MENFPVVFEASPKDAESIFNIQYETWLATYPVDKDINGKHLVITVDQIKDFLNRRSRDKSIQSWSKILENTNERSTWIVKSKEQIVGFISANKFDNKNKIHVLYVLPIFHGKNYGAALMKTALDWFGNENIILNVASYNQNAINFYGKFGFKYNKDVPFEETNLIGNIEIPEIEIIRESK